MTISEAQHRRLTKLFAACLSLTLLAGLALLGSLGRQAVLAWELRPTAAEVIEVPATATPSPAPTRTPPPPTPTSTPAPTRTARPTASPSPAGTCREGLRDGGFETGDGWTIVLTAHSAGYMTRPAAYVTDPVRTGQQSLRLGIAEGANVYSFSAAEQAVLIPANATAARLSFWVYPVAGAQDGDAQYLLLMKEAGGYDILTWELTNARVWQRREISLDAYRGQRVVLHFEVRNDGEGSTTALYVDDISLALCVGTTPTPHAPPTAGAR